MVIDEVGGLGPETSMQPARILVVDDESDLEILFGQIFRREIRKGEFDFQFVNDGREALDLLAQNASFEVVLSDIRMPRMDGLTLLENLNQHYPFIKVVMVTAYGDMENIRKAMNGGAFDFVNKPIHYQDLKTTILKTLKHAQEMRELHRAREEKTKAQERLVAQLKKLDTLKDEFLANTSHELRTPLNGIIGLVEALLEDSRDALSSRMERQLKLVLKSGRRLAHLVNDLLDFSSLKHDTFELEMRPLNMIHVVDLVLSLSHPLTRGKDLSLVNQIPADAPAVEANEERVQQILLNLVGNAIKFTDSGQVTVGAQKEGLFLRVEVSDTGMGISPERKTFIQKAFVQGNGDRNRPYGGSGLGLSITQKLVALHGGTISLKSKEGVGSVFSFTLPISHGVPEAEKAEPLPLSRLMMAPDTADEESGHLQQREGARILLVDDDPINLEVLAESLRGFRLTQARHGREALDLIMDLEHPYDVVLLDIMMPKISGLDVCRKIRAIYDPNELPVIIITAKNRLDDLVEGLEAGANDFITKPISRRELLARVKTHLQLSRLTRELKAVQAVALQNARAAGKADFATTVLHNVGNILSSIKVSCTNAALKLAQSKVSGLLLAGKMLEENRSQLDHFLINDTKGQKLPDYFIQVGGILERENSMISREVESMKKRIYIMEKAIESQQEEAKDEMAPLLLRDLVEESVAVQEEAIKKYAITVQRIYDYNDVVPAHQAVIIQILVNLIKNSIEAMAASDERILTIRTGIQKDRAPFCQIIDTGEGIGDPSILFQRGLTTKKDGHGFGLDYCRKAMRTMGGRLEAQSPGLGRGATFTLIFMRKSSDGFIG